MDRLDADLTEALARGREPRKLWPVLHSVEGRSDDEPRWWESWPALWCFTAPRDGSTTQCRLATFAVYMSA